MAVIIKLDVSKAIKVLEDIDPKEMTEAIVEGVTDAVFEETRSSALALGKNLGPRIARSLCSKVDGLVGNVTAAEGADGYIGLHVHTGGPIQSRNGKMLAIPTKWNNRRNKFASDRNDLQLVKGRKRCYLFKRVREGEVLGKPLFTILRRTKPQRPRPWWPGENDVRRIADEFIKGKYR